MTKHILAAGLVCSALLLTVIQAPFDIHWAAWIAVVPFVFVCKPATKPGRLFITAYLVSLVYWLGNLYWLSMPTVLGWAAFCLYVAIYWPLIAVCIRELRTRGLPMVICVPILFVGAEGWQTFFFSGFSWRLLGHSQYSNLGVIQIADMFGVGGISFLIAAVNGLIADIIIRGLGNKRYFCKANLISCGIVIMAVVVTLIYGNWRLSQTPEYVEQGPLLAGLQSNVALKADESIQDEAEMIFYDLLELSREAARHKPALIAWPETMVLHTLDQEYVKLVKPSHISRIADRELKKHASQGIGLLIGATGARAEVIDNLVYVRDRSNAAYFYMADGEQFPQRYDKIHLVPFGEYIPFRESAPWLYRILMYFTPYNEEYDLLAGKDFTVFPLESQGINYRFSVIICYEDTVARLVRKTIFDEKSQKKIDWIINISNDGWFVAENNGEATATTELSQHAAICVFRAVENRLSILRSVNTGISCMIDSTGRIRDGYIAGNLEEEVMNRTAQAGYFVDTVNIDKRKTFFTQAGQWFDFSCGILLGGMVFMVLSGFITKKVHKPKGNSILWIRYANLL